MLTAFVYAGQETQNDCLFVSFRQGGQSLYAYDGAGRVVQVTDALGGVTAYTYGLAGDILTETDANGNVTRYVHDLLGRITQQFIPDGSSTEYDYNAAGLLTLQKEVTKDHVTLRQIAYIYDDAGKLISDGTHTYTYDLQNRLTYAASISIDGTIYRIDFGECVRDDTNEDAVGLTWLVVFPADSKSFPDAPNTGIFISAAHQGLAV